MPQLTFTRLLLEYNRDQEITKNGRKLLDAIRRDTFFYNEIKELDEEEQLNTLYDRFDDMDPTSNNKYVKWLSWMYRKGQFRVEDDSRIRETLELFHSNKRRMEGSMRDINRYTTVTDLETAIEDFRKEDEQSSELAARALETSRILYDGPDGKVIVPESFEAAKYWGKGTSWCTSKSEQAYENYTETGPLYIIIDPDGKHKYQIHFSTEQMMDRREQEITEDFLNERYGKLVDRILDDVELTSETCSLYARLKDDMDEEEARKILECTPYNAGYLLKRGLISTEDAITAYPELLFYIHEAPPEIIEVALKSDPSIAQEVANVIGTDIERWKSVLKHAPYTLWSYPTYPELPDELVDVALRANGKVIELIPNPSEEQIWTAVRQNPEAVKRIEDVPEDVAEYVTSIDPSLEEYV